MADSSLDDFFAKKDKSKKKSKSKTITPSDILSKQEKEQELGNKKKKKSKANESSATGSGSESNINLKKEEDDEWVDFEQETEADYTGLRIQNLQIGKDKSEQEEDNNENDNDNECDENGEKKEGSSGPWNATQTQPSQPVQQAVVTPAPVPEKPKTETPATTGRYIPPGARAGASASSTPEAISRPIQRRKKTAPNLSSEEDFPTLGGGPTAAEISDMSGPSFNKVQSGGRTVEDQTKAQSLTLGNKFSALQD